jgi:hypothetical protein
MAVPDRARAQPKFWALGLGEPFFAYRCGKWLGLRLTGCFAAEAADQIEVKKVGYKPYADHSAHA